MSLDIKKDRIIVDAFEHTTILQYDIKITMFYEKHINN